ncbi:hypothetical protein BDQ12DRAFT_477476 [Crucibulum laeve]|uniref:Uncharacterized protein n=1 Tax=Crucibulum laeve TaxID=68775 RepID=A0A5C3LIV7_9AGAR|nr:hypothetical protein BDQ12DRAFT_477476 [Crucibulum laeve]
MASRARSTSSRTLMTVNTMPIKPATANALNSPINFPSRLPHDQWSLPALPITPSLASPGASRVNKAQSWMILIRSLTHNCAPLRSRLIAITLCRIRLFGLPAH